MAPPPPHHRHLDLDMHPVVLRRDVLPLRPPHRRGQLVVGDAGSDRLQLRETTLMGAVSRGPWTGPPITQPTPKALAAGWWRRDHHGQLWVWCSRDHHAPRWTSTPVPMAKVTRGIPHRSPNRDRITAALDLRMLHGPEVDEALGVANALDTVVDSWEAGTAVPTEDEVRRLATLTGRAPEWFYDGALPHAEPVFICKRGAR